MGSQQLHAAISLTDKGDANGVVIPTGNTATSAYIMETQYNAPFLPSVAGTTAGFRFKDTDSSPATLLTSPNASGDLRQGVTQDLAGNENNGYVGTVVGKAWGNAMTLSLGSMQLVNGLGADLYITIKNVDGSGVVQSTSSTDKSMSVGFHMLNGPSPGWHLYNPGALPINYQPADGFGNVMGAIDLSSLKLSAGNFLDADLSGISTTIPLGTLIDKVILVNSNVQNDWAFGYRGDTIEAPTGFVARRDFDNADNDGDGFTGLDYLTGRYGTRPFNGQDGPQAWFFGMENVVPAAAADVPEPASLIVWSLLGLTITGAGWWRRRRLSA
jgi:hypothetical protein